MKAIDKSRFKPFLSPEEEALGHAAGSISDEQQRTPGNIIKPLATRAGLGTR